MSKQVARPAAYGVYICDDGRIVLFNREYQPVWEVTVDGGMKRADPKEVVRHYRQITFYNDKDALNFKRSSRYP